jgi:hypothetical protein
LSFSSLCNVSQPSWEIPSSPYNNPYEHPPELQHPSHVDDLTRHTLAPPCSSSLSGALLVSLGDAWSVSAPSDSGGNLSILGLFNVFLCIPLGDAWPIATPANLRGNFTLLGLFNSILSLSFGDAWPIATPSNFWGSDLVRRPFKTLDRVPLGDTDPSS